MNIVNQTLLQHIGIELEPEAEKAFADHLSETFNERAGRAIIELLDEDMLEQFIDVTTNGSEEEVYNWLHANVQDYQEIVHDEYYILMGEVAHGADVITT